MRRGHRCPFGGGGQVGLDDREVGESLQDAPAAAGGALRDFDGPDSALGFVTGEPDGQVGGESHFLMHQADPVQTLGTIAQLVRPGGWIIVQEPLANPPPRSYPPLDALDTYWGLLHEVLEQVGVPHGTVEALLRSAHAAGPEVAAADGFFILGEPELAFEIHASTLAAFKEPVVMSGIPAETIDALIASLRAGKAGGYEWVSAPFFLDLALRKTPVT